MNFLSVRVSCLKRVMNQAADPPYSKEHAGWKLGLNENMVHLVLRRLKVAWVVDLEGGL